MERTIEYQRVLALAGVFQAADLAHNIASQGKVEQAFFTASIASLLKTTSDDLIDIYGSELNLKPGIDNLAQFLKVDSALPNGVYIAKYASQLLKLGGLLNKDRSMAARITQAIRKFGTKRQISSSLIEAMAGIYYDNFSQLSSFQRIRIMGKREYLSNAKNVSRIRALLLAGVRAAILWRGLGGNQWTLLFNRKTLANEVIKMRAAMKQL